MALANAKSPSVLCPVDAPVNRLILKGLPFSCSAWASFANSFVVAFGAPAGVNPDRPIESPFLMSEAASAAVIVVYICFTRKYSNRVQRYKKKVRAR